MKRTANKSRGEVAVPEFGDGAFLRFTLDSLERLESKFGPKYFDVVMAGLQDNQASVVKEMIRVSLRPADMPEEKFSGHWSELLNLDDLKLKIYDAFFLMNYGKTLAEKQDEERKQLDAEMKRLEENPQLAAALLSRFAAASAIEPASPPTSSET